MGNITFEVGDDFEQSAHSFAEREALKPIDGSDIPNLEAAKQEIIRLRQAAKRYRDQTIAADKLQAMVRMRKERKLLARKKYAAVQFQSIRRSHGVRRVLRMKHIAALKVQARIRGRLARARLLQKKRLEKEREEEQRLEEQQQQGGVSKSTKNAARSERPKKGSDKQKQT